MKHFRTANASKPVTTPSGLELQFEAAKFFGGAWIGVFAAQNAEEENALSEIASDPKSGITEISLADYDKILKKKETSPGSVPVSPPPQPPPAKAAVDDRVGVLAAGDKAASGPVTPAPDKPLPEKVEEVLQFGNVKPPASEVQAEAKTPAAKPKKKTAKRRSISETLGLKPKPVETVESIDWNKPIPPP